METFRGLSSAIRRSANTAHGDSGGAGDSGFLGGLEDNHHHPPALTLPPTPTPNTPTSRGGGEVCVETNGLVETDEPNKQNPQKNAPGDEKTQGSQRTRRTGKRASRRVLCSPTTGKRNKYMDS